MRNTVLRTQQLRHLDISAIVRLDNCLASELYAWDGRLDIGIAGMGAV